MKKNQENTDFNDNSLMKKSKYIQSIAEFTLEEFFNNENVTNAKI